MKQKSSKRIEQEITNKLMNYEESVAKKQSQENFTILRQRAALEHLYVPSQPLSVPSPRGMLSRGSGLPLDTQDSTSTSGNVFESCSIRTIISFLREFKEFGFVFLRDWHPGRDEIRRVLQYQPLVSIKVLENCTLCIILEDLTLRLV